MIPASSIASRSWRRVDAGAAVDDSALLAVDAELGEAPAQLLGRLEAPVRAEVLGPRSAARARDVAGLGVDRLLLAAIALAGARVDQRHAGELARRLRSRGSANDPARSRGNRRARHVAPPSPAARPTPARPPSSTACALVAEAAQQEPQPRRDRAAHIVVDDDLRVALDARRSHLALELLAGRQRVPPLPLPVTSSRSTNTAPGMCPRVLVAPFRPTRYQRKSMTRRSGSSMCSCSHRG